MSGAVVLIQTPRGSKLHLPASGSRKQISEMASACEPCKPVIDFREITKAAMPPAGVCARCLRIAYPSTTKRCRTCRQVKGLDQFSKGGGKNQGPRSQCRVCASKARKDWREKNPALHAEHNQRARDRAREKDRARNVLKEAIASGEVVKPDHCEGCGSLTSSYNLHGHHHDYSKPLEVEWLCSGCHLTMHGESARGTRRSVSLRVEEIQAVLAVLDFVATHSGGSAAVASAQERLRAVLPEGEGSV